VYFRKGVTILLGEKLYYLSCFADFKTIYVTENMGWEMGIRNRESDLNELRGANWPFKVLKSKKRILSAPDLPREVCWNSIAQNILSLLERFPENA